MRGGNQNKITPEQREEILGVYVRDGAHIAGLVAQKYGLCHHYPSALACKRGLTKKRMRPLDEAQKIKLRKERVMDDSHDHRWQWAIERGAVCV